MKPDDYPDDADGDALRRVESHGSDMSKPMSIDFTIDVPDRMRGEAIARLATDLGYTAEVSQDDESGAWTCYCTRSMLATYDGVVSAQRELEGVGAPLGGHCDGWGTFGNAKSPVE